jgi:HlyD family secretion protein
VTRPLRRPAIARAAAAAAVALLALTACGGEDAPVIEVAAAGTADVVEVVEAPATVSARASAELPAPADGVVAEIAVVPGQEVVAGDLLLRVDSPSARDRLRQARAADAAAAGGTVSLSGPPDLSGLQAQSDIAAETSFATAREAALLLPEGEARTAALQRVEQAEARYAEARSVAVDTVRRVDQGIAQVGDALSSLASAQRVQTRAAVELAEATVDALEVTAPISGFVQLGSASGAPAGGAGIGDLLGQLPEGLQASAGDALGGGAGGLPGGDAPATAPTLTVGALVTPGDTLATVVDVSELSLTAEVDETDVLRVQPGVRATVELDAVPGAGYDAEVTAVDLQPSTSQAGGVSYRVRLVLGAGRDADGGPAPRPRPGMSAVADLAVREDVDAVAVPVTAVQRGLDDTRGESSSVWVDVDGVAQRREVVLGAEGDDLVAVLEGLDAGERVVVRGADTVAEGESLPDRA